MTKLLFEVDCRWPVKLYEKLVQQRPQRAMLGENGFTMHIDDNARHVAYVFLEWKSLPSAHAFLQSTASQEIVAEWPIEKVLGAMPLTDFAETYNRLKSQQSDASQETPSK